jgi:mannonate dehydratase
MIDNRRDFIRKSVSIAATVSVSGLSACTDSGAKCKRNNNGSETSELTPKVIEWPVVFGADRPKLCVGMSPGNIKQMRQYKQIGVDYVLTGGPQVPWTEKSLREIMDPFKSEDLTVINMMIGGNLNNIYGREGRNKEIKDIQDSIRAAGAVGLPVVEYNFYAHRLMEGYYEVKARGGAGYTAFDYERGKNLPTDLKIGPPQTAEMLWDNLSYFLKAVIPVAEKAGVRMALHPNDPPVQVSHGHAQIIATFKDWKRLIEIIDSPSNGMTYDCGVCREMGEDPLEVLRYLGSRDRINHMHYRNVTVQQPYVKYEEVFFDEGQVNMFAVMQELFRLGYKFGIYPEHPRAIDFDKEHPGGIDNQYPGGGGYTAQTYNVAYTKAMMQAVASFNKL